MGLRLRAAVLAGIVAGCAPASAFAQLEPIRPAPLAPLAAGPDARTGLGDHWTGGAMTASTGETVHVYVYGDYGDAAAQAFLQTFVDFLAWLPHGPLELARISAEAAPLSIVHGLCGAAESACYLPSSNDLVVPADAAELPAVPGIREELIAREFAYAIADFRNNSPWVAADTGPKFWATAEHVCERTAAGLVYPGAEGGRVSLNPGAAWAESYRRSIENVTPGWGPLAWSVDESFLTDEGLAAVSRDVTEPWTRPRSLTVNASLTRKNRRRVSRELQTPLDGNFTATLISAPPGATVKVTGLTDPVAFPTQFSGRICGERTVSIVVSGPHRGPFRLAISAP